MKDAADTGKQGLLGEARSCSEGEINFRHTVNEAKNLWLGVTVREKDVIRYFA
jgi:hypothetical protein